MDADNCKEGQISGEQQAERSRESTYHTDPDLLLPDNLQVFVFSLVLKSECDVRVQVIFLLYLFRQKTEIDREQARKEMELQLEAWRKLSPGSREEVSLVPQIFSHPFQTTDGVHAVPAPVCVLQESAASCMWHQFQHLTSALSQQLCEQLRLILEPTQAAKLKSGPWDVSCNQ